ncbi:hypothetical protein DY000_02007486 [Brassica cretica]|uniref:Malectin-like domain-containing protein n=1 Tax=Brassica cretica TaxID=69181 RepID=A0ABQ7C5U9_BRACR|nr:hypothetical protein DY000_02007486 [Brassica cretica]
MRTHSKTSLNVCSLKLYQSCMKASSIDSYPLSIILAIRSARSFANGYLSDRVVVPPSKRFRHTAYSFYSDTRWVSIDVEVKVSIDSCLFVSFDGIRLVSINAASAGPLLTSSVNRNPLKEAVVIQLQTQRMEPQSSQVMYPLHSFVKPSSFFCADMWSKMFADSKVGGVDRYLLGVVDQCRVGGVDRCLPLGNFPDLSPKCANRRQASSLSISRGVDRQQNSMSIDAEMVLSIVSEVILSVDVEVMPSVDVEVVPSVDVEVVPSVDVEVVPSVDVEVVASVDVEVVPSVYGEVVSLISASSLRVVSYVH